MQAAFMVQLMVDAGDGAARMLPFVPHCHGTAPCAREHPRCGAGLDLGLSLFRWDGRGSQGTGPTGPAANPGTSPAQAPPGSRPYLDVALCSVPTGEQPSDLPK